MEPVRADVDAFLLDLLEDRTFTARDFGELPNGICRIAAPLTHELALALPHWRECLRPIAARLAQTFRESLVNKGAAPRMLAVKSGSKRHSVPGPDRAAARNASQSLAAAAVRNACMACANRRSAPGQSGCVRDLRRAGTQAQASSL